MSEKETVFRKLTLFLAAACMLMLLISYIREHSSGSPGFSVSVLFVGNSLTSANNLPFTLKKFAHAAEQSVTFQTVLVGGARLSDHWQKQNAVLMMKEKHFDVLVLQGQSTEPLFDYENFSRHTALFKSAADDAGTRTILFSTWALPEGSDFYHNPLSGGTPDEMQKKLNSAYNNAALQTGAIFSPVGHAFEIAATEASDIALLDGTQHPSPAGTYLTAAVLYGTLFNTSEISSTWMGNLPDEDARILQKIATMAMQER